MAALSYVGKPASASNELLNQATLVAALESGVTQNWVQAQVAASAAATASIASVATTINGYAPYGYATSALAGLVPAAALGAPSVSGGLTGVASLDSTGKVPVAQMPNVGAGYVLGPFNPTALSTGGSTTSTPLKIGDINIGVQPWSFDPMCFATVLVESDPAGQPMVEMRISNGAPSSYAATTLVAASAGQTLYGDVQPITVMSALAGGLTPSADSPFTPTYATWISIWVYDLLGMTVTCGTTSVSSCGAYLVRTS